MHYYHKCNYIVSFEDVAGFSGNPCDFLNQCRAREENKRISHPASSEHSRKISSDACVDDACGENYEKSSEPSNSFFFETDEHMSNGEDSISSLSTEDDDRDSISSISTEDTSLDNQSYLGISDEEISPIDDATIDDSFSTNEDEEIFCSEDVSLSSLSEDLSSESDDFNENINSTDDEQIGKKTEQKAHSDAQCSDCNSLIEKLKKRLLQKNQIINTLRKNLSRKTTKITSLENEVSELKKHNFKLGPQLMERMVIIKEKHENQEPFAIFLMDQVE